MYNTVMLIGRLGGDPDVHYTDGNDPVSAIRLATTDRYDGKTYTEWHRVVCFGRLAEVARQYLKKGSLVFVRGRLRTRKWSDEAGVDRYSTEVVVQELRMLPSSGSGAGSSGLREAGAPPEPGEADAAAGGDAMHMSAWDESYDQQ